jgi:hypothetical protein
MTKHALLAAIVLLCRSDGRNQPPTRTFAVSEDSQASVQLLEANLLGKNRLTSSLTTRPPLKRSLNYV